MAEQNPQPLDIQDMEVSLSRDNIEDIIIMMVEKYFDVFPDSEEGGNTSPVYDRIFNHIKHKTRTNRYYNEVYYAFIDERRLLVSVFEVDEGSNDVSQPYVILAAGSQYPFREAPEDFFPSEYIENLYFGFEQNAVQFLAEVYDI